MILVTAFLVLVVCWLSLSALLSLVVCCSVVVSLSDAVDIIDWKPSAAASFVVGVVIAAELV